MNLYNSTQKLLRWYNASRVSRTKCSEDKCIKKCLPES